MKWLNFLAQTKVYLFGKMDKLEKIEDFEN